MVDLLSIQICADNLALFTEELSLSLSDYWSDIVAESYRTYITQCQNVMAEISANLSSMNQQCRALDVSSVDDLLRSAQINRAVIRNEYGV